MSTKYKFQVDLLENLDKELIEYNKEQEENKPPDEPMLRPHMASIKWTLDNGLTITKGACARSTYYYLNNEPRTDEATARLNWIWENGKWWEATCHILNKRNNSLVDNNIKFRIEDQFPLPLKGEMDGVNVVPGSDPPVHFITEYKTTGGSYQASVELLGNSKHKPFPKDENLLQLMTYLSFHRDIKFGMLIYLIRDMMHRTQFEVKLVYDHKQKTDIAEVNGEVYPYFSIDRIYKRYEEIARYFLNKELPPRDYDLEYTDEKALLLNQAGELSKSAYEKHLKGEKQGDWRCRFCSYTKKCYSQGS